MRKLGVTPLLFEAAVASAPPVTHQPGRLVDIQEVGRELRNYVQASLERNLATGKAIPPELLTLDR